MPIVLRKPPAAAAVDEVERALCVLSRARGRLAASGQDVADLDAGIASLHAALDALAPRELAGPDISRFVRERVKRDAPTRVAAAVMHEAYLAWRDLPQNALEPRLSRVAFGLSMRKCGVLSMKSGGCRWYSGVILA